MMRTIGGCVVVAVGVALMAWSLAIGFFEFEALRWAGGVVGFVVVITGVDLARHAPYPWWSDRPSTFR